MKRKKIFSKRFFKKYIYKIINKLFKSDKIKKYFNPTILDKIQKIAFFGILNSPEIFKNIHTTIKSKYFKDPNLGLEKFDTLPRKNKINYFDFLLFFSYYTKDIKKDFTKIIIRMINLNSYYNNLKDNLKDILVFQGRRLKFFKENDSKNESDFFEEEFESEEDGNKTLKKNVIVFLTKIENLNQNFEKIFNEINSIKNLKTKPELKKMLMNNFNTYLNKFLSKLFLKMRFDLFIKMLDKINYVKNTDIVKESVKLIFKIFIEIGFSNVDIENKKYFLNEIKNQELLQAYSNEIEYFNEEITKKILLNNFRSLIKTEKFETDELQILKFIIENHDLFFESENFCNLLFDLYLKSIEKSSFSLEFLSHLELILISNKKIDILSILFSKAKNINLINLIKLKQKIDLSKNNNVKSKWENINLEMIKDKSINLNYIQQYYLEKDYENFKILDLLIFVKNLDFSNLKDNKDLDNLEDLLQLKKKDINKNKFLLEKFRRDFNYGSNQKFTIFGINFIEEKNLIKKLSDLIFFKNDCLIYKLNLFLKFLSNTNNDLNAISFKYEKSLKNMIINIFIFIVHFIHLMVYSKNFYQNWKKADILFDCFHILNTLIQILNIHFLNFKKITNTNFISSIIFLINLYTDYLGRKKKKIFRDFENFEKKNIEKFIQTSLKNLDKILFEKFELKTILIGFLENSFKGVNNFNILKFIIKSVNNLDTENFTSFLFLLRKKFKNNTNIINYLYTNNIPNLFLKYQHNSDFLGFFLNIIFNLPLNLFIDIENDVYLFIDKILQNYNIDFFKKFQSYFTILINESIEFLNQNDGIKHKKNEENSNGGSKIDQANEKVDEENLKRISEGFKNDFFGRELNQNDIAQSHSRNENLNIPKEVKNIKQAEISSKEGEDHWNIIQDETQDLFIEEEIENKDNHSLNNFKEFKKILYTISLLERSLCNPIFKSFFVYEKKSDILLKLEKKLNSINIKNFEDSKKFLLQIRKKILNSLIFCIDYNFGIRSLLKKSKNEKRTLRKKLVEDMPIEKHISEIFIYIFSLTAKKLATMNDDIFGKFFKVLILLCNNDLGKNVLLSLIIEEENLKFAIFEFLKGDECNFEKFNSILSFLNIFLTKPSDSLNLKLCSFFFDKKLNRNNPDEFYKNLIDDLKFLIAKSQKFIKENSENIKKEKMINYTSLLEALEHLKKKKKKVISRIERKIKIKFIDEMPKDISKRINSLNKKLSTKYFKNQIEDLIKQTNYKTLVKLIIDNFQIPWNKKISNYYVLNSEQIEYNYFLDSELIKHHVLEDSKNKKVWRIEFKNFVKKEIFKTRKEKGIIEFLEEKEKKDINKNQTFNEVDENEEIDNIPLFPKKPEIPFWENTRNIEHRIEEQSNQSPDNKYSDQGQQIIKSPLTSTTNIAHNFYYPQTPQSPYINNQYQPFYNINPPLLPNIPNIQNFQNPQIIPNMPIHLNPQQISNRNVPNIPMVNIHHHPNMYMQNLPSIPIISNISNISNMSNMSNIQQINLNRNLPNPPLNHPQQKSSPNLPYNRNIKNSPNMMYNRNQNSPNDLYYQSQQNFQNINYPPLQTLSSPYMDKKYKNPIVNLTPQINSIGQNQNLDYINYTNLYGQPKFISNINQGISEPYNPYIAGGGYYEEVNIKKKEISSKLKKYNFSDEEENSVEDTREKTNKESNSFLDQFKGK